MTIQRAMQLEEVNNELIQVLLGLTARVRTAVKMLKECDHEHPTITNTLLSTFQAEGLLNRVATRPEDMSVEAFAGMAQSELQGENEAAEPRFLCVNPNCVDGLAPRKTGPDDGDVDMEPCPVCGGPQ